MDERVGGFVEGLISKTREGKLDWQLFSSFPNKKLDYTESREEKLECLRLLIENHLEQKYSYPDVLYNFMNQILSDEN